MAEILNCHKVEGVAYSICLVVIGHDFVLDDFEGETKHESEHTKHESEHIFNFEETRYLMVDA
ncbi:hypothetical protein AS144_06315 [Francisella endosymbiont of Amblyomma maculatum]|nr:hypothetical protein AS144_06315 [Francisella endosymbiont of Amblyomma maculatum]